ncbi:hypothetical protein HGI30_18285 [Paenibacillus albicereus]|uniref:Uncharacterized protein n=1 Tax=Paenibacillus albicereus TaxID=2726185 RepID=A0A6H2H0W5_9BACL|nr:hypothetical protein [Paenibacillus albicereus]QJC53331.1 hypothetical protein HGI30_18285 [Paenibacillus albicereus]
MSHRSKRKKRSRNRGGLRPRAGRLLLALAMAAAVVPAVLGYLNHRELERGTTETAMALLPQDSAAPAPSPAGAEAGASREKESAGGASGSASKPSPAPDAGTGEGGDGVSAEAPLAGGAAGASPSEAPSAAPTKAQPPAGAMPDTTPSGAKAPAASAAPKPDSAAYERRLDTIREQCVAAGAAVLQGGEARLCEARSGELTEPQLQQAEAELAGEMDAAESGCRSRFERLIAEAEAAEVPADKRSEWMQSYEQSRELLRAGLAKQLDALASAAG